MKEDIEQAVLEMSKKSGVELGEGELESIIDASFNTASEHISNALSCIPLKEGATHTSVLVWYAKTPEMPGTVQKRVALVAFIVPSLETGMGPVARFGAWYDDKIIFSNCYQMESREMLEHSVDVTLIAVESKCETVGEAFVSVMTSPDVEKRHVDLVAPPGLLEMIVSGDYNKAIARVRELDYGRICDLCRSDLDLINVIVEAGRVCDGVLAQYASQISRLANEMPMLIQEAKSHAVHAANDLLTPYRYEAASDKMTGWATW